MKLTITHLYPEKMNLYGDMGNITTLVKRAKARGIKVTVKNKGLKTRLQKGKTDIYFFGGGQDQQQVEIAQDLIRYKKNTLQEDLENKAIMLAICGGYQLLGKYYLTGKGTKAQGVGFLPIETVAPGTKVKQRCIGNIATKIIHPKTQKEIQQYYKYKAVNQKTLMTLVGFENHSGRTRILTKQKLYIGKVIKGVGDSEKQGHEGLRYKNTFGSYMHGSLLPKNPHLADLLLSLALKRKYPGKFKYLEPIDDKLEWQAHETALKLK